MALAMLLLAFVVWRCLPGMWKDYLEYRISNKELDRKAKELDLQITKKIEKLAERGEVRVTLEAPKKQERAVAKLKAPKKESET
jgi:hypothetical protein